MSGESSARKSLRIPVSVVLERRIAHVGPWSQVQWEAVAAVAGEEVVSERGAATLVHEDDECRRYLWPGLVVELFPDGCESYWYNLLSERPFALRGVLRGRRGRGRTRPSSFRPS